jgi:hypothetical protein
VGICPFSPIAPVKSRIAARRVFARVGFIFHNQRILTSVLHTYPCSGKLPEKASEGGAARRPQAVGIQVGVPVC